MELFFCLCGDYILKVQYITLNLSFRFSMNKVECKGLYYNWDFFSGYPNFPNNGENKTTWVRISIFPCEALQECHIKRTLRKQVTSNVNLSLFKLHNLFNWRGFPVSPTRVLELLGWNSEIQSSGYLQHLFFM